MSQYGEYVDDYGDDEDLADFIVSEDMPESQSQPHSQSAVSHAPQAPNNDELTQPDVPLDRISALSSSFRANMPETSRLLKAHISVLVSALGGPDHSSEKGIYKLGHDALACLKDIKRWIRAVDEKNAVYDVALACAECELVKNDLTVILCQWDKPAADVKRPRSINKILLACLELLVLLTWPTDVNRKTLFKDYTAKTNNRRAQLAYKHHIISYKGGATLKAVLRLGLHALKVSSEDREPRDVNILRLILYFIRNVLYIEPLPASKGPKAVTNSSSLPYGLNADEIALPAVIQAFERNNVLLFITTIAHSVSTDLEEDSFGILVMECLSLLTKGVSTQEVVYFKRGLPDAETKVPPASSVAGMTLSDLLSEEDRRKKHANKVISTRHGRFGTLLSIQNHSNSSHFAVSGQKALSSTYNTLEQLDESKNWHKTSSFKYDSNAYVSKSRILLGYKAAESLSGFVNQLLTSSSFNNLLVFVGRYLTNLANDRDLGRRGLLDAIDGHDLASYFLTIAWFFRFKRESAQFYAVNHITPSADQDDLTYGSVGAALSEVNFILLISYFRSAYEAKDYDSLHVAMICFKEMLLISHTIFDKKRTQREIDLESEDDVNEDRELAEGIIRKLFSQKQFLDICVNIPKTASKHSPEYLGVVVSVVHILLKCFGSLANEDVHLFIKIRRKMRKMENRSGLNHDMAREHLHLIDKGSDEEDDDDEEEIRYITQERKLDFRNTEVKFFHPETVSTHVDYLSRYEDLSAEEIKRGLSYFHRLFVVRKDYSALYRLDFMLLLYNLQAYLPKSTSIRRHVDEFIVYFMRKFKTALGRFPMALELIFPRLENIEYKAYLSTGDLEVHEHSGGRSAGPKNSYFDSEAIQPRAAPLLQFIDEDKSLDDKIAILVYHLAKKKNTLNFLTFLVSELSRIAQAVTGGKIAPALRLNLANRRLLICDPHLRLLLETIGFGLPYLQNDETTLHPSISGIELRSAAASLEKWVKLHHIGVGDIEPYLDQIRRLIFSQEQLDFGIEALGLLRQAKPFDSARAAELELDEHQIHKVIGLAKRKEYDENMELESDVDDDFVEAGDNSESANDNESDPSSNTAKRRKRRRVHEKELSSELDDNLSVDEDSEFRQSQKKTSREVAIAKSAELVHDSDDESDDERNRAFFAREERLRQLISQTGGITDKDQLKLFRKSWAAMANSDSSSHIKTAIEKASVLFVSESEDESNTSPIFSQQNTPINTGDMSTGGTEDDNVHEEHELKRENNLSRKRRLIIDDDDDDEL